MKRVALWIIVAVVLIGGIGGFLWFRRNRAQAQSSDILREGDVSQGDLAITVSASGNVIAERKIDLTFDTIGTVSDVHVEVGERVDEGDVLAEMETNDLERALRQSEIALDQAELTLEELTKPVTDEDLQIARTALSGAAQSLEVARIAKESAQSQANEMVRIALENKDRVGQQYQNILSDIEAGKLPGTAQDPAYAAFLQAEGELGIAQVDAELKRQQAQEQWLTTYNRYQEAKQNLSQLEEGSSEEQIRQTELQVEQAQINLEQARENLEEAVITAPFDGIVAAVNLEAGAPAPASVPAITLVDDSQFYVEVTVGETDIGKVREGMEVEVILDAYPDTPLTGVVESIAPAATDVGGIIAYPVKVRLEETNGTEVREGMTASVSIETSFLEDILLVPNWAVRTDQQTGETYAYCYCDGSETPQRVDITIGARNESYTQILSGLEEGDTVVLVTESRSLIPEDGPGGGRRRP